MSPFDNSSRVRAAVVFGALLVSAACANGSDRRDTATAAASTAAGDSTVAPASAAPAAAPDSFRVTFTTSRGPFVVQVNRAWAPRGADRFYELVQARFYDDDRFFRVVPHFVAQFGINDKPKINDAWDAKRIVDDSVRHTNARGTLVFASEGLNTRTHQVFINLVDNARLDKLQFAPIGKVIDGMNAVDSLYSGYGEQPDQQFIQTLGNSYLNRVFPKLDYIKTARISAAP
jgi:cyclophilin family peptidyl-prolyl cis-trans isomerase